MKIISLDPVENRFGTPTRSPYLTSREAASYLRYRSASAIRTLKMRGSLRPAGRRGGTDLYRRDDLDRFVLGNMSGSIDGRRPDAPGREYSHERQELDGRLQADAVPGHLQDDQRLPRARARGRSANGHAEGGESGLRRDNDGAGGAQAGAAPGRHPLRRRRDGTGPHEVRALREILVRAKAGNG